MSQEKRFVKVVGLNKIFVASSSTLDVTQIKPAYAESITLNSIVFLTANATDEQYGYDTASQYVWTHGELYPTNDPDMYSEPVSTVEDVSLFAVAGIPVVDKTSDSLTSFMIDPNKMYMFGTKTDLSVGFNPGDSTIVNEYMFQFTSGNTATTLTVPTSVVWLKDPDVQTGKKYAVSIENNLGVIGEWSNE